MNLAIKWLEDVSKVALATIVRNGMFQLALHEAIAALQLRAKDTAVHGGKIYLIGNGGSAAAASHLAVDFCLADLPALALNDPVALSSHANDFGARNMFSVQLKSLLQSGDMVIALSTSGESENIIDACDLAKRKGCYVVTMHGKSPGATLGQFGLLSFYTPSRCTGLVQLAQEAILHAAVDTCGTAGALSDRLKQGAVLD